MTVIKEKETNMEIQTTIKDFPKKVRQLDVSPGASVRLIIKDVEIATKPPKTKKSKWAEVAERISKEAPLRGASEEFLKFSREFRDNFRFREPPHFEKIKTDD